MSYGHYENATRAFRCLKLGTSPQAIKSFKGNRTWPFAHFYEQKILPKTEMGTMKTFIHMFSGYSIWVGLNCE
jgi:hypothetical protein